MAVQIDGSQGSVIATSGDYSGGVSIGGTLTYEDVTNIDAVGLITARSGIEIGASPGVGASISVDGNAIFSGITTFGGTANFAAVSGTTGSFTGNLTISNVEPTLNLTDTNNNSDFAVRNNDGTFGIRDTTNGAERFTIASNGQVRIGDGATSDYSISSDVNAVLQLTSATTPKAVFIRNDTSISDGDHLGLIDFHSRDGGPVRCARIGAVASGTHATDDNPTDLIFRTCPDGSASDAERVRIASDGKVAIGNGSPQQLLHVWPDTANTTSAYVRITAGDRGSGTGLDLGHDSSGNGHVNMVSNGHLHFSTNNTERLRIMNDGRVGIKFTGNYTMNSSSTNLVIGDGGSGVGMTFWTAVGADNQTISFQSNETLTRAEGEIKYGPSSTSVTNDRHAMMFRTNSSERVRIASDGKVGIQVTDPKSLLHVYGPGDIRMGSGDTGVATIALQVEHADDYTGTHFMFEITDSACWTFSGSHIAHGGGGSSYGLNVTYIRAIAGRESGAADSGDTWRNGTHYYNSEVMTTSQIGLNPGAGSVSFAADDTPDGSSSTRSLYKIAFSGAGQGAVTTWGKLQGVLTWASTSSNGIVKIKDKDGNVLWNSRP